MYSTNFMQQNFETDYKMNKYVDVEDFYTFLIIYLRIKNTFDIFQKLSIVIAFFLLFLL